jgi:hypothetical protein
MPNQKELRAAWRRFPNPAPALPGTAVTVAVATAMKAKLSRFPVGQEKL